MIEWSIKGLEECNQVFRKSAGTAFRQSCEEKNRVTDLVPSFFCLYQREAIAYGAQFVLQSIERLTLEQDTLSTAESTERI